jgi:hypothetical protein
MAKKHVILVPGGSCWRTYAEYITDLRQTDFRPDFSPQSGWQNGLKTVLGADFKVLLLDMPNWRNAHYREWKIWFEKALAVAAPQSVVVGHSLGGIFLIKYFAETVCPPRVQGIFLVSAPYALRAENPDFGDFALKAPPRRLTKLGPAVHFYHSPDDPIVHFADFAKYREVLPEADARALKNRGHFHQNRFPELARDIAAAFSRPP